MAERKRAWFNDMKEWMENIAVFLDEKVFSIVPLHLSIFKTDFTRFVVPQTRRTWKGAYIATHRALWHARPAPDSGWWGWPLLVP